MSDESIDLRNLNQKELLVLLYERSKETSKTVNGIKESMEKVTAEYMTLALKVNTLEVKAGFWGGAAGVVVTILIEVVMYFLKQ
ncbi:MAG: hypothetical protein RIE86_09160 [Imperialibacter sp.]|uniref:hypothetical protein n=1 Tax=Imperialibacter sp. TaxID=2038411 RepID=UPI0032EDDC56